MYPVAIRRWVFGLSTLESVARLLSRKMPAVGDALLGALELAKTPTSRARSPVLCQAALEQVAADTHKRDLSRAIPRLAACTLVQFGPQSARSSSLAWLLFFPCHVECLAAISFFRWLPLNALPLPSRVGTESIGRAHGEDFDLSIRLASSSKWTPPRATATESDNCPHRKLVARWPIRLSNPRTADSEFAEPQSG